MTLSPGSQIRSQRGLPRRRFVQGVSLAAVAGVGFPRGGAAAEWAVLRGDRFDLVIDDAPINVTGRQRIAKTVNGTVPAPILRFREGDVVTINVTNRLREDTSIHWHGLRLPADMDGVPGLSFPGIRPGETFTYRFRIRESGTFWYHSHSGMQEQLGLYGPLILEPRAPEPYAYDREYVLVLSDWTDEDPHTVVSNLKQQSDYYNFHQRTVGDFFRDVRRVGIAAATSDRLMWGRMRMSPTDIMDVTGATYTFLVNGHPPAWNWTALFTPGERIRLRFVNSASMTTFDVRIPDLPLKVVQADGSDVEPIEVDEFRIGVAETYDVIVEPRGDRPYTVFAQAQDRTGFARATLAPRPGMVGEIPPMDPRQLRTMADMGMGTMEHGGGHGAMRSMSGMNSSAQPMETSTSSEHRAHGDGRTDVQPGTGSGTGAGSGSHAGEGHTSLPRTNASGVEPSNLRGRPWVDNVATDPKDRLAEAGNGLDDNERRVLTYAQLRALRPTADPAPLVREIEFHLTGNMERWVWGFDGKRFSEAPPVRVTLGEKVRFVLVNDTMMEHPIHLHGFLFAIENGQGDRQPLKHTVNVKSGERMSFVFTADTPGHWAFHCHLQFHMETGMFRTVVVS